MMSVDNLPAEFPTEASEYFSKQLLPFVPALAGTRVCVCVCVRTCMCVSVFVCV